MGDLDWQITRVRSLREKEFAKGPGVDKTEFTIVIKFHDDMRVWSEWLRWLHEAQLSAHPEVHDQPLAAIEIENEKLSPTARGDEFTATNACNELLARLTAYGACSGDDGRTDRPSDERGRQLSPNGLDLGQLRHVRC